MEYLVLECSLSYAVVIDSDGRFLKVPNLGYTVGQTLSEVVLFSDQSIKKPSLQQQLSRWGSIAACLCLLIFGSWFWQSPIGTVRIQINPDVRLSVNRFDRVVSVKGLNEDGIALTANYRAYGKEMQTVTDDLADRAMEMGYLHNGGKITLTVNSRKEDWRVAAEELLLLELDVHFDHHITITLNEHEPEDMPEQIIIVPVYPDEHTDNDALPDDDSAAHYVNDDDDDSQDHPDDDDDAPDKSDSGNDGFPAQPDDDDDDAQSHSNDIDDAPPDNQDADGEDEDD